MSGYLGDLSSVQEKSLEELKELLSTEIITADEATLLRFLRARSFDAKAAYNQYTQTREWRINNDIDHILDQDRPLEKEVKKIVSCGFHKHDKFGRPCYIEHTGRMDIAALLKLPSDQFIAWHIWNNEKQIQRMTQLSKKFDRPIESMVHIHDTAGATMVLRKALNSFKRVAKLDQDYYPERMGKIFIVNTPWVFPVLWKIAKIFLDPKTRAKCVVLKSSELHKLGDYFNPEDLPEEFGGTCRCDNGCLPPIPKHMLEVKDNPQLTEQSIGAKKTFTYTVDCDSKKGDLSIAWYFKATSKDIQFGVKFKPKPHSGWKDDANEIDDIWVEDLEPILECETSITGFYAPPCPGICTLVWDNSNCKWLSRTIKYHVMVSEADSDSDEEIPTNGNKENS
ncbi:hypothetical protein OS493_002774 [Desmophyllum pertusum]|uniref:CRAL-TRIO domain-containing protein n=1 Tax=Desmophyllum pertusum TaxID=174260 RepID=A0A9W9YFZ8_9CNID|nr:hypothetical protein OS493_002774 [Desmophyllum pertusum]